MQGQRIEKIQYEEKSNRLTKPGGVTVWFLMYIWGLYLSVRHPELWHPSNKLPI